MNRLVTGVLLPDTILQSTWFNIFAMVVAFNTIIFLGLTFSKMVPWPAQIHPSRVRAFLPGVITKDTTMTEIRERTIDTGDDPFLRMRMDSARQTIPLGLALLGTLLIVIALINVIIQLDGSLLSRVLSFAIGLAMLVLSRVLDSERTRTAVLIWAWTVVSILLVAKLTWDAVRLDSAVALTYAVIVMTITPAISMSWRAAITAGAIDLVLICTGGAIVEAVSTPLWAVAGVAALVTGLVILQLRLHNSDRLSLEQIKTHLLATTDPLTGLLARGGLLALATNLAKAADRSGENVYVVLCDISEMKRINSAYGLAYGDSVIEAVARSVQAAIPEGDLIARWDGDAFLALGIGTQPDAPALEALVNSGIDRSGVALGKTPITVAVACASGKPTATTIEGLVVGATAGLRTTS